MIISKEHKFIFIHIPKTAGSSMNMVWGEGNYGSQQAMIRGVESSDGFKKIRVSIFNEKKNSLYFENSVDGTVLDFDKKLEKKITQTQENISDEKGNKRKNIKKNSRKELTQKLEEVNISNLD